MEIFEQLLDNSFTIYINSNEGKVCGAGLKYLGKEGMRVVELASKEIDYIMENFPTIKRQLEEGNLLQIYMAFNHTYISVLGKTINEGPYGELEALDVIEESASYTPQDALIGLENQTECLVNTDNAKALKRMYRLYGSDKFETHNMYE